MARVTTPEAEGLMDREIVVLDRGFVRLVDYMGGDPSIVQAARVSYGPGTKSKREDRGLINYLMRHQHTTPFEMVELKFHVKLPIFVARQWIRHRTASVNEQSLRYSVMPDEFYVPPIESIGLQSNSNRQGRDTQSVEPELQRRVLEILTGVPDSLYPQYLELIESGVARELARICLPVSAYTEWYWKINLHNLFHFISLRADPHAQDEIRAYANALAVCARAVAPNAYAAFEEYRMLAIELSAHEKAIVSKALCHQEVQWENFAYFGETVVGADGQISKVLTNRRAELETKLGARIEVQDPDRAGVSQ